LSVVVSKKRTTLLIASDAGAAGRALLARRDIDLRWALTKNEVKAALAQDPKPRACLARSDLALPMLGYAAEIGEVPPTVVLIDADGWDQREAYFSAGATAIVQHNAEDKILEAIASLTGLVFRTHPRVPYATVADVTMHGERYFLESVDLSASGVTIRGLANARMGDRVELTFMMIEPQISASCVVARVFEEHGETLVALSFEVIDGAYRARLVQIVDEERANTPDLPEPVGLTHDLGGAFTHDLIQSTAEDENAHEIYRNMLREFLKKPPTVVRIPSWLERVARSLMPVERSAALGDEAPSFARATLDMRIQLEHRRIEGAPKSTLVSGAIELVRSISNDAAGSGPDVLVQVVAIRAALLRAIYGSPANESFEIVDVQELPR
jgi:hypothetical protein